MNFWHTIPKPIIGLSPMDGVTDASFRWIAAKHGGPDITVTEFTNVDAAIHAPHTLIRDFTYSELERPIIAQIYGHTPELFYKAAHVVCELGFDGLDINMGCPAKNVAASGSGAALIRTPELAREIVRETQRGIDDWVAGQTLEQLGLRQKLRETVKTSNQQRSGFVAPIVRRSIPLSVKTRIGYDRIVVEDWIANLLAEKPVAISIHGRTLKQGYKGDADWDAIARAVAIAKPAGTLVLGNGDLRDMGDVYRRVRDSGVDGVLLGRAAEGNPWIFKAKDYLKQCLLTSTPPTPAEPIGMAERFSVVVEHARHFESYVQERSFVSMRKHLIWYCREFRGAAELRTKMVRVNKAAEVIQCLRDYESWRDAQAGDSAPTPWPAPGDATRPASVV
ncbi:MAG: tRNA-dihydrouridine synthase [Deltaproteobacteria bacterium]|nr:tRNA-dihydrouridine synthase [Deltaproteobacteria bacterium]